jgi:hypothetical protein
LKHAEPLVTDKIVYSYLDKCDAYGIGRIVAEVM